MFPTLASRPKHLYINSRLHVICIAAHLERKTWRFTLGEPYLLLTPRRLKRLRAILGRRDPRLVSILETALRMVDDPVDYYKAAGVRLPKSLRPDAPRPPVLCPRCDHAHTPHPLDAERLCPDCVAALRRHREFLPSPPVRTDRLADRTARRLIRKNNPEAFVDGELTPNWRINASRRLERDWDEACRRISMGFSYRQVAREFECSLGLVHKKVQEHKHWENN